MSYRHLMIGKDKDGGLWCGVEGTRIALRLEHKCKLIGLPAQVLLETLERVANISIDADKVQFPQWKEYNDFSITEGGLLEH